MGLLKALKSAYRPSLSLACRALAALLNLAISKSSIMMALGIRNALEML